MSRPLLRRSPRIRCLALVVQVLAVLCQLAEGTGQVHCPHHDLVPRQAMAGMDHGMGPGMGDGATPVHHNGAAGHACTCLGECCVSAGALPSSPMPALVVAVSRATPARFSLLPSPRHPGAHQPPSTGPPVSA